MLQTTARRPRLVSPTGDESPPLLPDLPEELIFEILLRVPAGSLLRFRCVCKSWKTLISDPQFAKDHLSTSKTYPNMIHQRLVYSTDSRNPHEMISHSVQSLFQNPSTLSKPQSLEMSNKCNVVGSCNGLLCLFDAHLGNFRLWNPCTRLKSYKLSIDYHDNIDFAGFGYDHVNHKYKVIAILKNWGEFEANIYSFGSNSCTEIQNFLSYKCTTLVGKFVRGTLNWISKRVESGNKWVILYLDLATETLGEVLLPRDDNNVCPMQGVSDNCLCVCFFDSKKDHWSVWLMKEFGVQDSWTKLMIIPHNVLRVRKPFHEFEPLHISENGVVLLQTLTNLILYNSNDGRFDYLKIRSKIGLDVHIHLESLVSPEF